MAASDGRGPAIPPIPRLPSCSLRLTAGFSPCSRPKPDSARSSGPATQAGRAVDLRCARRSAVCMLGQPMRANGALGRRVSHGLGSDGEGPTGLIAATDEMPERNESDWITAAQVERVGQREGWDAVFFPMMALPGGEHRVRAGAPPPGGCSARFLAALIPRPKASAWWRGSPVCAPSTSTPGTCPWKRGSLILYQPALLTTHVPSRAVRLT